MFRMLLNVLRRSFKKQDLFCLTLCRNSSSCSFRPFYENFQQFSKNIAVIDSCKSYTYKDILRSSFCLAKKIKTVFPDCRQQSERIAFLCTNDATYVSVLLACWITGNIAVPLCNNHPKSLLEYYITDSKSKLIISNPKFKDILSNIILKSNAAFFTVDHDVLTSHVNDKELGISEFFAWDNSYENKKALIIYTSGTTGRPKGVVLTHGTLFHQVYGLEKVWCLSSSDSIFHSLPLHHIHGIMNALLSLLSVGGSVVMQEKFDAFEVWKYLVNPNNDKPIVNFFSGVPTMYAKLVQEFEKLEESESFIKTRCLNNMRLFVSGSASLPVPIFHRMEEMTGHRIVERFGMSEIGVTLSNRLDGPRTPGSVGLPVYGVEAKISKPSDPQTVTTDLVYSDFSETKMFSNEGDSGELMIRGPTVFTEYWNKKEATIESFTTDGWFKTGDTACFENGGFRILGRTSVDIIKSGGYKISALEVESCLLRHPNISECTVLGIPDDIWGERVAAVIIFKKESKISDTELKTFCKQYIPPYAVPTLIKAVDTIPRNVLGKVNKKELRGNLDFT